MSWLSGWNYRKSVTASRATGAVTLYQMKLLVGESTGSGTHDVNCAEHCLSTFNDLRFTAADGTTLLDYWIEGVSGATPNQVATVWVELDSIGTGATTFYMYYGKSDASAGSSGTNTFVLFDHFDDGSFTTLWDEHNSGSNTLTESGTVIDISLAGTGGRGLIAKTALSADNYSVEALCKVVNLYANGSTGLSIGMSGKTGWGYYGSPTPYANCAIARYGGSYSCGEWNTAYAYYNSTNVLDSWVRLSARVLNDEKKVLSSSVYSNGTSDSREISGSVALPALYPYVYYGDYGITDHGYCDWLFVRKAARTEPAWGAWGDEEGSGATEYNLELSDSTSIADAVIKSLLGGRSDTIAVSDNFVGVARQYSLSLSDSVGLTELKVLNLTANATFADSVNLSDNAVKRTGVNFLSDSLSLADAFAAHTTLAILLNESITVTDSITGFSGSRLLADTTALTDHLSLSPARSITFNDVIELLDLVSSERVTSLDADTLSLTDVCSVHSIRSVVLDDLINTVDSIFRCYGLVSTDIIDVYDTRTNAHSIQYSDSIGLLDVVLIGDSITLNFSSVVLVSDALIRAFSPAEKVVTPVGYVIQYVRNDDSNTRNLTANATAGTVLSYIREDEYGHRSLQQNGAVGQVLKYTRD